MESYRESRPEAKLESYPETKPQSFPESKPESYLESKTISKPESKIEKNIKGYSLMIKKRKELDEIFQRIQKSEDKNEKKLLFEQLLKEDNINEEYNISYLLFIQNDINFETILKEKQIYISDTNYKKYFKEYLKIRKSAKIKILDYLNLIKNSKLDEKDDKKQLFFKLFGLILLESKNIIKPKKEITWKNEELYLNNLYKQLLESISLLIIQNYTKEEIIDENENIKFIINNFEKLEDQFIDGDFFNLYIYSFKNFLINIDNNFKIRFKITENQIDLSDMESKILFEEYIQFIFSYPFCNKEENLLSIWNETFVSLNKSQKNEIFKDHQMSLTFYLKAQKLKTKQETVCFNYNDSLDQIEIIDNLSKKKNIIYNVDDYAFSAFIHSLLFNYDKNKIEWYKNKFLKITKYKDKLFVSKTKKIWKDLIFQILNSKPFIEAKESLYKSEQINFFDDQKFLDEIIDNMQYFSYKILYHGLTNKNTIGISICGIYNYKPEKKESILLLVFYGFHIVTLIHELGGHINIKLQYYYTLNSDFESSPIIINKSGHTKSGVKRGKESGEMLEMKLFGRVINTITIKECLYILNKKNYQNSVNDFKKNFLECNKNNIMDLIDEDLKQFLTALGLQVNIIINDYDDDLYEMPEGIKVNISNVFSREALKNPPIFYNEQNSEMLVKLFSLIENDYKKLKK